ncbi:MAG: metal-dependent transcriptional regulator [Chloroflexi bacterium]|nr:metal-dependent transcriptional regulator [Chloroflexota bacterium]
MIDKTEATATVEEYLETIINILSEGKKVHGVHLAERLQVAPPTVVATIQRMTRDGLIITSERKEINLTERGRKIALSVVKRHRLAERMLTDILKMPWHEVHQEACRLEHGISQRVIDRLYETLGRPQTCPHGNPIPDGDVLPPLQGVPLDTVTPGNTVIIERISEEANRQEEVMQYLAQAGLMPGSVVTVNEVASYAGTMQVTMNNKKLSLGIKAATMVWVMPAGRLAGS